MDIDVERRVHELFDRFDALDMKGLGDLFDADIQGVDEIAKSWQRGKDALRSYFSQLEEMGVSDVKSTLSDLHTEIWGDAAVATMMLDQAYRVGDERELLHAPTTIVFRRRGQEWKIALVHSVPLEASKS